MSKDKVPIPDPKIWSNNINHKDNTSANKKATADANHKYSTVQYTTGSDT